MMPRWWLAPNYEPLRRDADGLAWELRGQGVRCLTEQDFLDDAGQKQHSGKAEPTAQKWADTFTAKIRRTRPRGFQLRPTAQRDGPRRRRRTAWPRNASPNAAGLQMPNLMNDQPLDEYPAPRSVPSQASFVKAGRNWVVSVSGGVQIFPWQVADRTEVSNDLAADSHRPPRLDRLVLAEVGQAVPDAGCHWLCQCSLCQTLAAKYLIPICQHLKGLSHNRSMGPWPVMIRRDARAGGPCYRAIDGYWDRP